jgi:hypothetical protein
MNQLISTATSLTYAKKYYLEHRDIVLARSKAKYITNRENRIAQNKLYYESNKTAIIARSISAQKQRYANDPEYRAKRSAIARKAYLNRKALEKLCKTPTTALLTPQQQS